MPNTFISTKGITIAKELIVAYSEALAICEIKSLEQFLSMQALRFMGTVCHLFAF